MIVQILDGSLKGRRVAVPGEQFEKWLAEKPMPGESDRVREYFRTLLAGLSSPGSSRRECVRVEG
jgi:hypothetical protein